MSQGGSPLWRRLLKIVAITVAGVFLLFSVSSWILFQQRNDLILDQLQVYLDKTQSGQLEVGSMDLELFRNFPQITLAFDSVKYYEQRDTLRQTGERPILSADRLYFAVAFRPLVQGHVEVTDVSLSRGSLNLVEYEKGKLNLDRALAKPVRIAPKPAAPAVHQPAKPAPKHEPAAPGSGTPKETPTDLLRFAIDHLRLTSLTVRWQSRGASPLVLTIKKLDAEVGVEDSVKRVRCSLQSTYSLDTIRLNRTRIPKGDLSLSGSLVYEVDSGRFLLEESRLAFSAFEVTAKGYYHHGKNRMLDMELDASTNDLPLLSRIVRPGALKANQGALSEGDVYLKGRIFGELRDNPPQVDVTFGVSKLALRLPRNLGMLHDLGFDGSFRSGALPNYSQAILDIKNIRGDVPGGSVRGNFYLTDFVHPKLRYRLDAQLNVEGFDELFAIDALHQLKGMVAVEAAFKGPLDLLGTHAMDSSRSSSLRLDNVSFVLAKSGKQVHRLNARMVNQNNQSALTASFGYGRNDVTLDANLQNLAHFLFKGELRIAAEGHIESTQFFTEDLVLDTTLTASVHDRFSQLRFGFSFNARKKDSFSMPEYGVRIENLSCTLDKLPDIRQLDVAGRIAPSPRGLTIAVESLHATMPQGKADISGNLLIPKKREIEFEAAVHLDKFPWTYVKELVAEIRRDAEPTAKQLPPSQMEWLTADLDISTAIHTKPFDIRRVEIRKSKVAYRLPDERTFAIDNLEVNLEPLFFTHPLQTGAITGLARSKGSVELTGLRVPGLTHFNISLDVDGTDNQLDVAFKSQTQRAESEAGRIRLDFSGAEPSVALVYEVKQTPVEDFVKKISKKNLARGLISYSLDLKSHGKDWTTARENLEGTVAISSDSLRLYGVDIDDVLTKYNKSQRFNLTDVGAVILAGPVGIVATKGSDFVVLSKVSMTDTKYSTIDTLVSRWKLDHRLLSTEDVALTTRLNRIAFAGSIDFARDSIPGLQIAVVDKNGCSLMDQQIYGKFSDLKTGKLKVAKTLLGSVINFANSIVGKDCKPVYTGSVRNPKPPSKGKKTH